jgi:hypothetical protein
MENEKLGITQYFDSVVVEIGYDSKILSITYKGDIVPSFYIGKYIEEALPYEIIDDIVGLCVESMRCKKGCIGEFEVYLNDKKRKVLVKSIATKDGLILMSRDRSNDK